MLGAHEADLVQPLCPWGSCPPPHPPGSRVPSVERAMTSDVQRVGNTAAHRPTGLGGLFLVQDGYDFRKVRVCVRAESLSRVRLFAVPWTVAHQVPLSMEFSRQEYGFPCPPAGNCPKPGVESRSLQGKWIPYCLPLLCCSIL